MQNSIMAEPLWPVLLPAPFKEVAHTCLGPRLPGRSSWELGSARRATFSRLRQSPIDAIVPSELSQSSIGWLDREGDNWRRPEREIRPSEPVTQPGACLRAGDFKLGLCDASHNNNNDLAITVATKFSASFTTQKECKKQHYLAANLAGIGIESKSVR